MSTSAADWLDFHAPQFAALDTDLRVMALTSAGRQFGAGVWGAMYNEVVGLAAAHILTLRARAEANSGSGSLGAGNITSMRTGGQSITWSMPTSASSRSEYYAQTEYGQLIIELSRKVLTTPIVAGATLSTSNND